MDYPIKTLRQLRPILMAFRKSAGMTQAKMASHLGVTQQTYAQLESNPASASLERLFKVLQVLNVEVTLSQAATAADHDAPATSPSPPRGVKVWTGSRASSLPSKPPRQAPQRAGATAKRPKKSITNAQGTLNTASDTKRGRGTSLGTRKRAVITKRENW